MSKTEQETFITFTFFFFLVKQEQKSFFCI